MRAAFIVIVLSASPVLADCYQLGQLQNVGYFRQGYHHAGYHHNKVLVLHQVGAGIREEAIAERAAAKALEAAKAKYDEALAAMRQQFSAALSGKVCIEFGGAGGSAGSTAATHPASPDTIAAQAVINNNCVRCHSGPGSRGGDADFRNLAALDPLTKSKIYIQASTGAMPPKGEGEPVSDADSEVLKAWILGK